MTTPLDIITQALKAAQVISVGETPQAEDANDCLFQLNMMIAQWQQKRWMVYQLVDLSLVSSGLMYYTVGPGGDFDTGSDQRPDKVESAFMRFLNNGTDFSDDFSVDFAAGAPLNTDIVMKCILAREDYNRIWAKRVTGPAGYFFYDTAFPLGKLYFWPIPNPDIYALHISVKKVISQFTALNQTISLPAEYMAALYYNLALRVAPMYGADIRPDVNLLAADALETVRGANAQVPTLAMPDGVMSGWSNYNIFNDAI